MNSSTIVRRVAGVRTLLTTRTAFSPLRTAAISRSYATPSEERDPQLNGYPQLPWLSNQHRPAKGWQDPLLRRDFGETLHEQDEVLSMWGPDVPPGDLTAPSALVQFMVAAGCFAAVGYFIKTVVTQDPPAIRREYPFSGLVTELGGLEENKARPESLSGDDE